MASDFSITSLEAYLDEALSADDMSEIEATLRDNERLRGQLAEVISRRDAGVHSLGDIWRRQRITCPPREQLGSYLLGALSEEVSGYVTFHLETVACRYCQANLEDLRAQQAESNTDSTDRRHKFFQSSAGYLKK